MGSDNQWNRGDNSLRHVLSVGDRVMKLRANIDPSFSEMWHAYRAARSYDPFGNITQIANPAVASSSATTAFTYDALNRLLSASTTAADSIPYKQQYEYDTLGSILAWATNSAASSTYSSSNAD